jgi:hypothetical protein
MKLNAMGGVRGQVLFFAFTHIKSDPVNILLSEGRLTVLEHKCIKYVFVGSGLAFYFYLYRRMLEEFPISKRRI